MTDVLKIKQYLAENLDKRDTPQYRTMLSAYENAKNQTPILNRAQETKDRGKVDFNTFFMGTPVGRFIQGAADLPLGAAQFVGESLGSDSVTNALRERETQMEKGKEAVASVDDSAMTNAEGFDFFRLLGNIMQGVGLTKGVPIAASVPGKIAQGAGIGAVAGAASPATSENVDEQKAGQIGLGALTGAVIPTVTGIGKYIGNKATQAFGFMLPGGAQRSAREALRTAAGDKVDDVVQLLDDNKSPLGRGNAGEVATPAGRAEFSALQKLSAASNPSRMVADQRAANTARVGALESAGGTLDDLNAARNARSANANPLYEQAWASPLNPTDEFVQLLDDPFIKATLPAVDDVATSRGIEQGTTEYFHLVKKALDGALETPANKGGLDSFKRGAIERVRKIFIEQLGKSNPTYEQARAQFAKDSPPINEMQVIQFMKDKLSPALADSGANANQRAAGFAQSMRDAPRTIKSSTGSNIFSELEEVITPEKLAVVKSVADDLARANDFEQLAKAGLRAANEITSSIGDVPQAKILERSIVIANAALSKLGKKASEDTLKYLEDVMRDPVRTANLMRDISPESKAAIGFLLGASRSAPAITVSQEN